MYCAGQYEQNEVLHVKIWDNHIFTPFGVPVPHFWGNSDNSPENHHIMAYSILSLPDIVILSLSILFDARKTGGTYYPWGCRHAPFQKTIFNSQVKLFAFAYILMYIMLDKLTPKND